MNNNRQYFLLAACILLTLGTGFLSSLFMGEPSTTYQNLIQPSFAPPSWIFGPVWTILYLFMGIGLYRILTFKTNLTNSKYKKPALICFSIQLFLNFLWSIIFFGLELRGLALIEILALLISIIATIYYFNKLDKVATYLYIPYLAWVSFASLLNFLIWYLNK